MTNQELQMLALNGSAGFRSSQSTSTLPSNSNGTVVVSQVTNQDGTCFPCDEAAACEIRPTNAVAMDLGKIQFNSAATVRFNVVVGPEARHLTFLPTLGQGEFADYPSLDRYFSPNALGINAGGPGVTINGLTNASLLAENNRKLTGGAVAGRITINYNSDLPGNAGLNDILITQFHLPIGIRNSVVTTTEYGPFCDCCVNSAVEGRTTLCFTSNFVETWRDGFDIFAPANSNFTIEICYSIIDLPNTMADRAINQFA